MNRQFTDSATADKPKQPSKPKKPHPAFPLFPHATRRWAKKVGGKTHYFGPWDDPNGALEEWLRVKDDLLAGRKPRPKSDDDLRIGDLCNRFLNAKRLRLGNDELSPRTFADCKSTTDRIIRVFGKDRAVLDLHADDFAVLRSDIAKTRSPVSLGNEINRVRGVFKFAYDNDLIDRPVKYGSEFKRPSPRVIRKERSDREKKFFEADEIRKMLERANVQMRAMILLAMNGGMGNTDVASLPIEAVDLQKGMLNFPRKKTYIDRRFPLWPETCRAIEDWQSVRPQPKDEEAHGHLLFITAKSRTSWGVDARLNLAGLNSADVVKACQKACDNPISKEMRKLLNAIGIKRKGVSFYSLRHVFETIGGDTRDQLAVDHIMGHTDRSMAAHYRERIDDERLRAVTDHVRQWLFGTEESSTD